MEQRRFGGITFGMLASLMVGLSACSQNTEIPMANAMTLSGDVGVTDYWKERDPTWVIPTEPFQILGDIYSVGTQGLAVYLIVTDEGHILIDGGLPGEEAQILQNIKTLGFDPMDIKILLNTHAHLEHAGGLAKIKEITGASFHAREGDVAALETGRYLGGDSVKAPPIKVDVVLTSDDGPTLGGVPVIGYHTPGHTPGCTSWWTQATVNENTYGALLFCAPKVDMLRLSDASDYKGSVADYRLTFDKTQDWMPDIFLSNSPQVFNMAGKREIQVAGDPLAFVDRGEFQRFVGKVETQFEAALSERTRIQTAEITE